MFCNQEPSFGYKDYYEHFLQEDKSSFQSGKVFEEIYRRKDQDTMLRAAYDVAEKKGIPIFETTKIWEDFKRNHDAGRPGHQEE